VALDLPIEPTAWRRSRDAAALLNDERLSTIFDTPCYCRVLFSWQDGVYMAFENSVSTKMTSQVWFLLLLRHGVDADVFERRHW
jgi:hypothetical protein